MLENLKWYVIQIGLKKYVPMGIAGALATLGTYLAAHAGMLESWGITYGTWPLSWPQGQLPSGPCILVELDTLKVSIIGLIGTCAAMAFSATQHHATDVKSMPGGGRVTDPPEP